MKCYCCCCMHLSSCHINVFLYKILNTTTSLCVCLAFIKAFCNNLLFFLEFQVVQLPHKVINFLSTQNTVGLGWLILWQLSSSEFFKAQHISQVELYWIIHSLHIFRKENCFIHKLRNKKNKPEQKELLDVMHMVQNNEWRRWSEAGVLYRVHCILSMLRDPWRNSYRLRASSSTTFNIFTIQSHHNNALLKKNSIENLEFIPRY